MACRLVPSTTSHKNEALAPTLEIFERLGFDAIDLNLHHVIELGEQVDDVRRMLERRRLRVVIVSGGWCDFFDDAPKITETFESVDRQVAMTKAFGANTLRLFYGRLALETYSRDRLTTIADNLRTLSDRHPDVLFVFENHGEGASSRPDVCAEILARTDRPNIRQNFDPINFEHVAVNSLDALRQLQPFIAHAHLKGIIGRNEYCEFGEGDVDLTPVLEELIGGGYDGLMTVEYEGHADRTLRLYVGLKNAEAAVARLTQRSA